MQFWVYILHCSDGSFDTDQTQDLDARLWQHEQGMGSDWTRRRRPVRLVWAETAPTRMEAREFEMRVKKWSRAKKIALVESDWAALNYWAKKPKERPSFSLGTEEAQSGPEQKSVLLAQSESRSLSRVKTRGANP